MPDPDGPTMPRPGRGIVKRRLQRLRPVDAIAEGDVLETDLAPDRRQRGACRIEGRLGRGVEDVAQPLDRDPRLMEILPDLREPQHRRADPPGEHVERNQLADREFAIDDHLGAEIEDNAVTSLLTSWTAWLAMLPRLSTRKLAGT